MKGCLEPPGSSLLLPLAVGVAVYAAASLHACTIFVLADESHALFCNNEDHPNPKTKIWFQPAGEGYYGAVYVGVETGYAQGGLNTAGLAFDWVAGYKATWKPDPLLPRTRGNLSQRMLETCATVKDAIAFHRTHWETDFSYARTLVADRTGASAILSAKDGQLQVAEEAQTRGFGFGRRTLAEALARRPQPTVANGFEILRACRQGGYFTTKYSNVFDLKSGDIFLYYLPNRDDRVEMNLAAELKKGAHYYDMPQIRRQLAEAPRPSPLNLRRFPLDEVKPLSDPEPDLTAHLRAVLHAAREGTEHAEDFTPEMWKRISVLPKGSEDDLIDYGDLLSMTLAGRDEEGGQRIYYYRSEYANATVLQQIVLDGQNKIASGNLWVDVKWKPGGTGATP
jgi:hypothetical protein